MCGAGANIEHAWRGRKDRACAACAHTGNIKHAQGMHIGSIKRAQKCVIIEKGADAKCIRAMLK